MAVPDLDHQRHRPRHGGVLPAAQHVPADVGIGWPGGRPVCARHNHLLVLADDHELQSGARDKVGCVDLRPRVSGCVWRVVLMHGACVVARFWTFWNHFFFWGSIASYFLFLVVYNVMAFGTPPFYYSAFVMFTRPTFWLLLALVPFACVIFDLTTMQCVSPACCACVCVCVFVYVRAPRPNHEVRVVSCAAA